jgi:EmrB/QacA subfamily drug resistance transporter
MRSRQLNQKIAVSVVYVAAMFMAIMDTTIVNVALPTLGRQFHTAVDGVDTVVIAFLVSLAVFIPVSGWLGDRIGGRRALLGAVAVFTVASALCGQAHSLAELVFFRVLQGVGGGLMTPVGLSMLFRVFPPAERVRASSILVVPTALAPALGPVLGGLFTTDLSWRWVFYVNVPIGIAAFVFGLVFLTDHEQPHPGRLDLVGFALSGVGLGLAMYGVSEGPIRGWSTPVVLATLILGIVLLSLLVAVELRRSQPLIDLRVFSDRLFSSTTSVLVIGSVAFLGTLYLLALFYQNGLGLSALQSGLTIFPEALGVMAGAQMVTRVLYPNLGPRRVMSGGLVVVAATIALLTQVGHGTDLWWVRLDLLALGIGMSGVFIPAQAASFATISSEQTGRASTIFNAGRQLGGAVGVAVLTTVLAAAGPLKHVGRANVANLSAYHVSFLAAAGIALLAVIAALTVRDHDAAGTMVPRHRHTPAGERTETTSTEVEVV